MMAIRVILLCVVCCGAATAAPQYAEPSLELITQAINRSAQKYSVNPKLIAAIVKTESEFNALAESEKGAQGAMQIMPITQQELDLHEPFDLEANIDAGTQYLRQMLLEFDSIELALWAYNAGPQNARDGNLPPETRRYIRKVTSYFLALQWQQDKQLIQSY